MSHTRVSELTDLYLNGALSAAERSELEALLLSDPASRQQFWQTGAVHAQLHLALDQSPAESAERVAAGGRRKRQWSTLTTWTRDLMRDFAREPVALAVLVLVMISGSALIWGLSQRGPQQPPVAHQPPAPGEPGASALGGSTASGDASNSLVGPNEPRTAKTPPGADAPGSPIVASLTGARNATWGETAWTVDSELRAGQRLSLKEGVAEISFESGATVVLEGPAELEVGGKGSGGRGQGPEAKGINGCSLTLGKLFANVPQQAHGFTVVTPDMTIVDRGTQFGVAVKPKSEISNLESEIAFTSVQVFQGLVEVQRHVAQAPQSEIKNQKSEILTAGEAITSDPATQPTKVEGNPTGYVLELPTAEPAPPVELVPLATWPKDSPLGPGDIVAVSNASGKFHLFKIDPRTGEQKSLATGVRYGSGPNDHGLEWNCVAVEPDGNVLVGAKGLNAWDAGLLRIDPRSGQIKVVTRGGLLKAGGITAMAVAAEGTIYASYMSEAHAQLGYILKIDPATGKLTELDRFGTFLTGIGLDVGQRQLLACSANAAIGRIQLAREPNVSAAKITGGSFGRKGEHFDCLAVTRQGRIFVGIGKVEADGGAEPQDQPRIIEVAFPAPHQEKTPPPPVTTLALTPQIPPLSMAGDADGNLVVASGKNQKVVYRVDTSTGKVTELSSGGLIETLTFIAVVPGESAAPKEKVP